MTKKTDTKPALKVPKPEEMPVAGGYYCHYKHDPKRGVGDHVYEVIGVGCHTEADCRPVDANMVIYRPLYPQAAVYAARLYDLRPLAMFMELVTKEGKTFPRFTRITDPITVAELDQIRKELYGA